MSLEGEIKMIYDFKVKNTEGKEVSLSDYKGKVLLIVNTATGCGFTPQYEGLQKLYDKYGKNEFEILDFPSNQFFNQAPGSKDHCLMSHHNSFWKSSASRSVYNRCKIIWDDSRNCFFFFVNT